jgi:hypothetical protein
MSSAMSSSSPCWPATAVRPSSSARSAPESPAPACCCAAAAAAAAAAAVAAATCRAAQEDKKVLISSCSTLRPQELFARICTWVRSDKTIEWHGGVCPMRTAVSPRCADGHDWDNRSPCCSFYGPAAGQAAAPNQLRFHFFTRG